MKSATVIRPAAAIDVPAIVAIYNEAVDDGNATFDDYHVNQSRYEKYFSGDERRGLISAVCGSEVVGWAGVDPVSDRHAYRFTAEGSIYVRRDQRGSGLGSMLSHAMGDLASSLGYHSIIGQILSVNTRGLSMNLRDGYQVVGEIREAGRRGDSWIGLIVVQKMLSAPEVGF